MDRVLREEFLNSAPFQPQQHRRRWQLSPYQNIYKDKEIPESYNYDEKEGEECNECYDDFNGFHKGIMIFLILWDTLFVFGIVFVWIFLLLLQLGIKCLDVTKNDVKFMDEQKNELLSQ